MYTHTHTHTHHRGTDVCRWAEHSLGGVCAKKSTERIPVIRVTAYLLLFFNFLLTPIFSQLIMFYFRIREHKQKPEKDKYHTISLMCGI